MQYEIGGFFGICIIILYVLTILNYVMKFLNKRYGQKLKKHVVFTKSLKCIVRYHKLFGLLTIAFLLVHFLIQFTYYGLSVTGAIAAGVLLLQVALGIYGTKAQSKKNKTWLYFHRSIAVALLVAILVHVW